MNQYEFDFAKVIEEGERLRDQAIETAKNHADDVSPGWSDKCYQLLKTWTRNKGKGHKFMMESFALYVKTNELLPNPSDKRAYGHISRRAIEEGLVKGLKEFEPSCNPEAHRRPTRVLQVL